MKNHAFFAIATFSKINSFAYITSIVAQHSHQVYLLFLCVEFYKHNDLNIIAKQYFLSFPSKKLIEINVKKSRFKSSYGTFEPWKSV